MKVLLLVAALSVAGCGLFRPAPVAPDAKLERAHAAALTVLMIDVFQAAVRGCAGEINSSENPRQVAQICQTALAHYEDGMDALLASERAGFTGQPWACKVKDVATMPQTVKLLIEGFGETAPDEVTEASVLALAVAQGCSSSQ